MRLTSYTMNSLYLKRPRCSVAELPFGKPTPLFSISMEEGTLLPSPFVLSNPSCEDSMYCPLRSSNGLPTATCTILFFGGINAGRKMSQITQQKIAMFSRYNRKIFGTKTEAYLAHKHVFLVTVVERFRKHVRKIDTLSKSQPRSRSAGRCDPESISQNSCGV